MGRYTYEDQNKPYEQQFDRFPTYSRPGYKAENPDTSNSPFSAPPPSYSPYPDPPSNRDNFQDPRFGSGPSVEACIPTSQHSQPRYNQPQYNNQPYNQPPYIQQQYTHPHYDQPPLSQPHYNQQHYYHPQYSQQPQQRYERPRNLHECPVAISQQVGGAAEPYVRAYAPCLDQYGISEKDFIGFIDALNIMSMKNPGFEMLDMAGFVVGFVPFASAFLVSLGMSATAKIGAAGVSKTRTAQFIDQSNVKFFGPKGLKATIYNTDGFVQRIGFPRGQPLIIPIDLNIPIDQQRSTEQRRTLALQGYVAETHRTRIPLPETPNMMSKFSIKKGDLFAKRAEKVKRKDFREAQEKAASEPGKAREDLYKVKEKDEKAASRFHYLVIEPLEEYTI